eukprot:gb/GECH01004900.1/.p1 GENE.gb/GECH01004900.1/~~gb/GECH01004900.1/.p1  ORF type:complete len:343 (+),score=-1.39 gb/GECH01004900.1/:1-1029(+)
MLVPKLRRDVFEWGIARGRGDALLESVSDAEQLQHALLELYGTEEASAAVLSDTDEIPSANQWKEEIEMPRKWEFIPWDNELTNHTRNKHTRSYHTTGHLIKKIDFQSLSRTSKRAYLKTLVAQQTKGEIESRLHTTWVVPVAQLSEALGASPTTLAKVARELWEHGHNAKPHGNFGRLPWNCFTQEEIDTIRGFALELPLEPFPCLKCREKTLVLQYGLTKEKIYKLFLRTYPGFDTSKSGFVSALEQAVPEMMVCGTQKDVCNKCAGFRIQMRGSIAASVRLEYKQHIGEAMQRRRIYKKDKEICSDYDNLNMFCFDFKQNIPLPLIALEGNFILNYSLF